MDLEIKWETPIDAGEQGLTQILTMVWYDEVKWSLSIV